MTLREVLQTLGREGLIDPEEVARFEEAGRRGDHAAAPWFVRLLVGVAAWISALCLVAFLALADLIPSSVGAMVLGAVLFAAALFLRRRARGDFAEQSALALWFGSQVLILIGFAEWGAAEEAVCLLALLLQAATVRGFPDAVGRFLAPVFAAVALAALLTQLEVPGGVSLSALPFALAAAAFWWRRAAWLTWEGAVPVGYGLVAATFALLLPSLAGDVFGMPTAGHVATAALTLGLMAMAPRKAAVLAALLALGAATLPAPGVVAGLGALALGFRARDRVLMGMAWVFLAVFLTGFYYHLDLTLLAKSGVLAGSGALLLLLRVALR